MKNKLLIIIPIVTIVIILIIFNLYNVIYNSDTNKTKRLLIKEGYKCGKMVCTKEDKDIKYTYDYTKNLLTVVSPTYEFLMEEKTYTYNDIKKGYYCTYTTDNFTKGMKVDKTFTYSSPCDDYMENVNEILDIYEKYNVSK